MRWVWVGALAVVAVAVTTGLAVGTPGTPGAIDDASDPTWLGGGTAPGSLDAATDSRSLDTVLDRDETAPEPGGARDPVTVDANATYGVDADVTVTVSGTERRQYAIYLYDSQGRAAATKRVVLSNATQTISFGSLPADSYRVLVHETYTANEATATFGVGGAYEPGVVPEVTLEQPADVARVPIELPNGTTRARVTLGNDSVDYRVRATVVDRDGDGVVTLAWNTFYAGRGHVALRASGQDAVVNATRARDRSEFLPEARYALEVRTGGDAGGSDAGTDGGDAGTDGGSDAGTDGGDAGTDGGDAGTDGGDAGTDGGEAGADGDAEGGELLDRGTIVLRNEPLHSTLIDVYEAPVRESPEASFADRVASSDVEADEWAFVVVHTEGIYGAVNSTADLRSVGPDQVMLSIEPKDEGPPIRLTAADYVDLTDGRIVLGFGPGNEALEPLTAYRVTFLVTAGHPYAAGESTTEANLNVVRAGSEPDRPVVEISRVDAPSSVDPGDVANVTVTLVNQGERTGTVTVTVAIAGQEASREVEVSGQGSATVDVPFDTGMVLAGNRTYAVSANDSRVTGSIQIGTAADGPTLVAGDRSDSAIPGFTGPATALAVLLSAGAIARRGTS
jgi:hypothetical protein